MRYKVVVEGKESIVSTIDEAVKTVCLAFYLSDATKARVEDDLRRGYVAHVSYGFNSAAIYPKKNLSVGEQMMGPPKK